MTILLFFIVKCVFHVNFAQKKTYSYGGVKPMKHHIK